MLYLTVVSGSCVVVARVTMTEAMATATANVYRSSEV